MRKFIKRFRKFWGNEIRQIYTECSSRQTNIEEIERSRRLSDPVYLEKWGYKVYSQNDEDGIINEIFKRIGTTNKVFVEFGVQNGLECNSHFLLHKGWTGLWIEGSKKYCQSIREAFGKPISTGVLNVVNAFINKDNINKLISVGLKNMCGRGQNIDLLSIDIDGNDYWVWKEISCIMPRVVVIEYNAKFPPDFEWIMNYDEKHIWKRDDEQGASLKALEKLGSELGYQLVGTNLTGSNAFFVRKDLAENKFALPATAENLYNSFAFGRLKYISGHPASKYIG